MNFLDRKITREQFLQRVGLTTLGLFFKNETFASPSRSSEIKAIVFDAFPIFDPRPIYLSLSELFPENGKRAAEIWQTKQFSYQWLRIAGGRYKDFQRVTRDALDFALDQTDIKATEAEKQSILEHYTSIGVWSDVTSVLSELKAEGYVLSFLSNMTEAMLKQGIQNSNLNEYFDFVISTDQKKTYKPNPVAYKMGQDILRLKKEEILFVAFAGWDASGAKWFGYPTFWVNRLNAPQERLDAEPDGVGSNLNDLLEFVRKYRK
ncbi:haloacid dehalogenase type II [Leptospira sp. WS92.C1]